MQQEQALWLSHSALLPRYTAHYQDIRLYYQDTLAFAARISGAIVTSVEMSLSFVTPCPLSCVHAGNSSSSMATHERALHHSIAARRAPCSLVEVPSLAEAAERIPAAKGPVVVRGALQPVNWIERMAIPFDLDTRDIRVELDKDGRTARLPSVIAPLLPPRARDALCELAVVHAAASKKQGKPASVVRGRVALVKGVQCPRLHVDRVNLRTLATLYGPGTVVAPPSSVDLNKLLSPYLRDPTLTNEERDKHVLVEGRSLEKLACGDVAFLPGSGLDGASVETAAIHRSPWTDKSELRLVVQVDDWDQ